MNDTHSEVKRPGDFDRFWQEVKAELAQTPLDWERIPNTIFSTPDLRVDWLRFSSLGDTLIYGWLALSRSTPATDKAGYLWLPGYSLGNPPPRTESLYPQTITLGLNLHGNRPDTPYTHPYKTGQDYITQGIDSPQTYIYRAIVAHCLRALDVLAVQPEVERAKAYCRWDEPGRRLGADHRRACSAGPNVFCRNALAL